MGTINKPHTFVGDTKAKASEVNETFDEIYNEFNGGIDDNNINFNLISGLKELIFKDLYEVGDLWTTTQNVNPYDKFGFGTWERFGEGRVPVGYDSTDTDFDTGEKTGGEKEHQLTDAEMPSHNHGGSTSTNGKHSHTYTGVSHADGILNGDNNINSFNTTQTSSNGSHNHSISTAGSDKAHNNLQPYITVYMWKRTA